MTKKEVKAIVEKRGEKLVAVASTEDTDRVGDTVKASGWDFKSFKKNPVLLFAHKYNEPPIGIAKNIKVEGKKLIFEPVFHDITQLAREVKAMFTSDPPIMRAFSVGFLPLRTKEDDPHTIEKQELLEISAVPVPANAQSLIMASKSYSPEEKKEIDKWVKEKKAEVIMKPYPNFHSCRLRDPDKFQSDSFRTTSRTHNGKKYNVVMGKLKGEDKMTEQGYRYPKEKWETSEARKHCKDHDGVKFEPASNKAGEKQVSKKEKGVIPYSVHGDGPKADKDTDWDGGTEVKKATGDAKKLKKMHTWVDTTDDDYNPDERSWYKLPHHKGDGNQAVVWRGVVAAMAALMGARGGVELPEKDRQGVYNHLAKHYKQFDEEPPELKSRAKEIENKEGRVISGENRSKIKNSIDTLEKAVSALKVLLEISEPPSKGGESKLSKGRREKAHSSRKNRKEVQILQRIAKNTNNLLYLKKKNEREKDKRDS